MKNIHRIYLWGYIDASSTKTQSFSSPAHSNKIKAAIMHVAWPQQSINPVLKPFRCHVDTVFQPQMLCLQGYFSSM